MLDKLLYLYSTGFIGLLVITSALNASKGPSSLIIGILLIPVAGFLLLGLIKNLKHHQSQPIPPKSALETILNDHPVQLPPTTSNSFIHTYFHRKQPLYLLTLFLFLTALTTATVKSTLEFSRNQQLVHPLSNPYHSE